ncbi:MAG: single-stranded DNA-binding protein [Chloroflexota bacterium]|nr:single-stranded DNA-binding protein [Chloroflexota bacterium]
MAGLNKVMLIGHLGRDPELRYTSSGTPVCDFSVAVSRRYNTRDGQQQDETEWFRVTAWNKLAEICANYLTKGQQVYIEGRVKLDRWTGQDGQERSTLAVTAFEMQMLGSRRDQGVSDDTMEAAGAPAEAEETIDPDDLPF